MPSAQGKNMFADASVETTSGFDAAVMTGKTPDELLGVYAGWAEAYDAEMDKIGWQTPKNVAQVLKDVVNPPKDARILDVAAGRWAGICFYGTLRFVKKKSAAIEKSFIDL